MEGVMQCCWLSTHSQGSKANRSKCPKSWPQFNQNQDPVVLVVLRFPIKIQTRIRIKIGNPSVPRRGSHAMLTHGWGCPTNHPQFRAINCCQLRIGSCRPDLCRILGAFLHFPDNPNCGSPVICGGGKPPPPHCARLRNVYTGTIIYRHCLVGRDRENTKQKPPPHCAQLCNVYNSRQGHDKRYYQGRDRENAKQKQTQAWQW